MQTYKYYQVLSGTTGNYHLLLGIKLANVRILEWFLVGGDPHLAGADLYQKLPNNQLEDRDSQQPAQLQTPTSVLGDCRSDSEDKYDMSGLI